MPVKKGGLPRVRIERNTVVAATRDPKTVGNSSKSVLQAIIEERVWVAQNLTSVAAARFRCFSTDGKLEYDALCDDFGPMNMSCVIQFIKMLDDEMSANPTAKIAYCAEEGKRALTNAVFLLGAYMIIKRNATVDEVVSCFSWLDRSYMEPYRDATFDSPDFDLTLMDCWSGLKRGQDLGWIRLPTVQSDTWGEIDLSEYIHYDDPLNGDLHIVVPGKFVAFKGPRNLGGREYSDDPKGYRYFAPSYYVDIFDALDVTAVVRLNEPEYEATDFTKRGFKVHELEFEDCTAPPQEVVAAFFKIVDKQDGLVAVHCKAGLGRTGTLIALYMMRSYGFSAREAIAWLRIMRPGSVIGEQQHYLTAVDAAVRETLQSAQRSPLDRTQSSSSPVVTQRPSLPPPRAQPSATFTFGHGRSREQAAQVAAAMERRNSIRAGGSFRVRNG